jgi:pimeloyl-ACP methyl ester carboxylesterase
MQPAALGEDGIVTSPHRIPLDDGTRTTLESWGEAGPVMLCIHGMTSSRRSWERLARHYANRYRVFAYDQRGHGDSAEITGPMALARGVRDLQNVADALAAPVDVLLGHSWGGAVAIRGAASIGAKHVVAIDPMIRQVSAAWYEEYVGELDETFRLTGRERDERTREEFAVWDPEDVAGKVHAVHAMTSEPIARLWSENPPESWDLRETLAHFDRPLLLAMADRDSSIVEGETIDDVRERRSPNVEIVAFPKQGHNLHRTGLGPLLAEIDRFLGRRH